MSIQSKLRNLKAIDLLTMDVSLAIVKEYKQNRVSQYDIKYADIGAPLVTRLRNIVIRKIENSNSVEEYTFDCPDPEADLVRSIEYEATDFYRIYEQLRELNPEEDTIEDVNELVKAKAYLIVLRNEDGIQVVSFKTVPENWKLKRERGLIPLLYVNNQFEDLQDDNVFSISNTVDLIYFDELLFILSKKEFEYGLNFREGMKAKANEMYEEVEELDIFVNIDILKNKVGDNQRYLRKIATIKNLGHYRNQNFLTQFRVLNIQKGWNIEFEGNQIVFSDAKLDDILTILQNKRLHSEFTNEDFDVESVKPL